MTWATYEHDGDRHVGRVDGDHLVPLAGLRQLGRDTPVEVVADAVEQPERAVPVAEVRLLPPVPEPDKIFCVGLNYHAHVGETRRDLPTYPVLFTKFASSLVGPDDDIVLPPESTQVDYEGELAVVIGRPGRRIARDQALQHVLGVTVADDVTMRDYQYRTHQWLQGKAWERSTPMGPALVGLDQVDLGTAGIRTVVNGTEVQSSDLGQLIFDIPTLIATVSEFTSTSRPRSRCCRATSSSPARLAASVSAATRKSSCTTVTRSS